MPAPLFVAVLTVWLALTSSAVYAEWFDNARRAIDINTSQSDYGGATLRGGVNLSTGHVTTTLFKGQASIGGGCSAFDFGASFKEAFENIPDVIRTIAVEFVRSLPLIITCELEPVLCDVAKHLQAFLNVTLQAKYGQCQSAQHAAMYLGLRLRGDQVSKCLEAEQRRGVTIQAALHTCNNTPFALTGPDGLPYEEVQLIRDTLRTAGASEEMQTVAGDLLGDITLRAGNTMAVASSRSPDAMRGRFESYKERYTTALRVVTEQYATDGRVSTEALRAASVPDKPLSIVAVQALTTLQQDPRAYEASLARLSTANALSQLTMDCAELEAKLMHAMDGNGHLGAEERQSMERQVQALRRSLAHLMAQAEVATKHLDPAIDDLMARYTAMQNTATAAGLQAPAVTVPAPRFRTQSPMGYSR